VINKDHMSTVSNNMSDLVLTESNKEPLILI